MKQLILLSTLVFMFNACSDNAQKVQTSIEQKDYLENYYELEEVRYETYLKTMAG